MGQASWQYRAKVIAEARFGAIGKASGTFKVRAFSPANGLHTATVTGTGWPGATGTSPPEP